MATPPPIDGAPLIQLDVEIEGEEVGSRNYRFSKIGEPVPIRSSTFKFDPESLPTQPLVVSEKFRLLFVAHPCGFYVTRTRDVIASAKQIKDNKTAKSAQELCLVDVPVQNVTMLALSPDDSMLAATEGSNAHFFAVSALLHKEQKPSFSVQLDDSVCIKDLRWAKNVAKVYVILSARGELFYGSGHGPLSHVMENVDSVDWSVNGNFVAVARKNNISILSSQLKEKFSFSLPFRSVIGDNDSVNQVIKVDSVRWIRPDCIAVGCFELNDDGEEQNYIVQVITSKEGKITDAGSKAIVLSFNNVFLDFCSDVVLARNGPHLFLSYLDLYGLAFIANRNLSRQVGLLCWSLDSGKNEAAVIEILNDAWILYIDSQGDGEENVILGISVDKVSQDESAKLMLGDEDTEVSPCCVIICLTIDGNISVFHFASAADALSSPNSATSEEDNTSEVPLKHELVQISFGGDEGSGEQISSKSDFHILGHNEKVKADAESSVNENIELKSAVNSHTLKLPEPTRLQSKISNQDSNEETLSRQDAKSGMSFSSAKAVGDFSIQSLTWSNGRIDTPKTSAGRSLSTPFNEVDDSDKCTSQSAGAVLRASSDISKKAEPSAKFTAFGLRASNRFGNIHSLPTYTVSQTPLAEAVVPGKSPESENYYKDTFPSPFVTELPNSMQNASKQQFGNVEGMAKKLDILLQGIEGKGGFTDASVNSKKKLVTELEDTMWALSSRCRMWMGLVDDKSREVQLLLDKTAQVLVRKVYLEGIFKQDADSRYWELWNRQNLSSELELKRRHVLDLNQELTNQLIELERHFNSLEFNKFGGNGALLRNLRASESGYRHSRQIQSLQSLRHTMNAQLAAAEHLSGCLSEQMAVLSIESSGKENDVKKKLFESVGLSYNTDSRRSPDGNRTFYTQSHREQFTVSGSIASITQSVRNQASPQCYEPETARRHQYSLDWSWASFEPPKTTVKRVLLKGDYEKGSASQSKLNTDKQYLTPQAQKKVEVGSKLLSASAASLNLSGNKGYQGTAEVQTKQFNERQSNSLQRESKKNSALLLESTVSSNSDIGNFRPTEEKLRSDVLLTRKNDIFSASEPILVQKNNTSFHLGLSLPTSLPEPSLTSPSDSIWSLERSKIGSKPTTEDLKFTPTPASAFSSVPNVSERTVVAKTSAEPSQPCLDVTATTSSALNLFPLTMFSQEASVDANQEVSLTQTSVPSGANYTSTSSLSSSWSNLSSISLSSPFFKSESEKLFSSSPVAMYGSKTEGILPAQTSIVNTISTTEKDDKIQTSPTQPILATSISGFKLVPSASSALTQSEMNFGGSSNNSSIITSIIKSEKPHTVETLSPVAISSTGSVGSVNVVTDASEEEEMEEEAPETDQTTQAALGSLGGLGIGSIPNPGPGKPNPFGAVSQFTSPFTMSAPSSGLFRPATFSFQSPQPSEPAHPAALAFSGGFSSGNPSQISSVGGFGQPAQIGAGQQALGSVLGTFGQSRQLGSGLTGNSSFGGGFMGNAASASGGFASPAAHGGFASASTHGGFASVSTQDGFAGLAAGGGGFASAAGNVGPFAPAASAGGGGFGAFSSQQGAGTGRPPSEFFTQMRK